MDVAVLKLTSCSGCINELIKAIALKPKLIDIYRFTYFNEVTEGIPDITKLDVLFIEGSVTTKEQEELVKKFRDLAEFVVVLGTCAIHGGVHSLRVGEDIEKVKAYVYPDPGLVEVEKEVKPVTSVIKVDFYIPGCPVNGRAVLSFLEKFSRGGLPVPLFESVCSDCKRRGVPCLVVSRGLPCLGPITLGGCGAICPSFGRGCYGCYGLRGFDQTRKNIDNFLELLKSLGLDKESALFLLKSYSFKEYAKVFEEVI